MPLRECLSRIDRRLCLDLRPWWLRLWWHRLWIRADEFHPSLDRSTFIVCGIKSQHGLAWWQECKQAVHYDIELTRRRNIAHERTLNPPKRAQLVH